MVISDAEAFVDQVEPASFDGVFVDFQDTAEPPSAYFSAAFWSSLSRLIKPGGLVVINVTEWLYGGEAWRDFQLALLAGGLDAVALGDEHGVGNRVLVSSPHGPQDRLAADRGQMARAPDLADQRGGGGG